jgi:hypothetical protein
MTIGGEVVRLWDQSPADWLKRQNNMETILNIIVSAKKCHVIKESEC